jgi:RNA polymerase sigma factor (sigma-70 family)
MNEEQFQQRLERLVALVRQGRQEEARASRDLGDVLLHCQEGMRSRAAYLLASDPRLGARVDADDVVSEAQIRALRHFHRYADLPEPRVSFRTWLQWTVNQTVIDSVRQHLLAARRSVGLEVRPLSVSPLTDSQLADDWPAKDQTSPSQGAVWAERQQRLRAILEQLARSASPAERRLAEVVRLRHYEQLSNPEVAARLNITESKASTYYWQGLDLIGTILKEQSASSHPPSA